jgi:hypothetical protein
MEATHKMGLVCCGLCTLLCSFLMAAQTDSTWSYVKETPAQHAAKMEWWNTARFGMFVHWGVYSATGGEFRGKISFDKAGEYTLQIRPDKNHWQSINLRQIELKWQ